MATFLPPLNFITMYSYWEARLKEVEQGSRHIIVYLSEVSSRTALGSAGDVKPPFEPDGLGWPIIEAGTDGDSPNEKASGTGRSNAGFEVSGVVSLATPFSQTGPFRGLVEKLFVSPLHRRKGIARTIMAKLEAVAWDDGRWSLMLDTTVGTDAEHVYPRLGYTALGVVNEYGISPKDGSLKDEIWFWKDLRKTRLKDEQYAQRAAGSRPARRG